MPLLSTSLSTCYRARVLPHATSGARTAASSFFFSSAASSPAAPSSFPSPSPSLPPSSASASLGFGGRLSDVVLGFLCGLTLYYGVEWLLYWPDPLPLAASLASADPLVQAAIGRSLRCSPLWTGNVHEGRSASVAIPVRGEKGAGTLYARAVWMERERAWRFVYLQAALAGLSQRHALSLPQQHGMTAPAPQDAGRRERAPSSAQQRQDEGEGEQQQLKETASPASTPPVPD